MKGKRKSMMRRRKPMRRGRMLKPLAARSLRLGSIEASPTRRQKATISIQRRYRVL
jgi:hypothetical protein